MIRRAGRWLSGKGDTADERRHRSIFAEAGSCSMQHRLVLLCGVLSIVANHACRSDR
jgi:hypothetical protein